MPHGLELTWNNFGNGISLSKIKAVHFLPPISMKSHKRNTQGGDQSLEGRADRTIRGRGVHVLKPVPDLNESGEK